MNENKAVRENAMRALNTLIEGAPPGVLQQALHDVANMGYSTHTVENWMSAATRAAYEEARNYKRSAEDRQEALSTAILSAYRDDGVIAALTGFPLDERESVVPPALLRAQDDGSAAHSEE